MKISLSSFTTWRGETICLAHAWYLMVTIEVFVVFLREVSGWASGFHCSQKINTALSAHMRIFYKPFYIEIVNSNLSVHGMI